MIYTGVWDIVGNAYKQLWGALLEKPLADGKWRNDLLLTSRTDYYPLYDLGASYLTSYNFGGVLELGAGVNFNRLLPNRPSQTTPEIDENAYFDWAGSPGLAAGTYYAGDTAAAVKAVVADSAIPKDYQYYTFKDTKVMARASFDPKPLFGNPGFLGAQDLRLYAEAVILGLKDYPVFYDNLRNRIPVMVGLNLPAFKILDVLAVELQYWTNPWYNSNWMTRNQELPHPWRPGGALDLEPYTKDDLKWTVFAQKNIFPGVSLFGQVARDHIRPIAQDFNPESSEITIDDKGWYYMLRLQASL